MKLRNTVGISIVVLVVLALTVSLSARSEEVVTTLSASHLLGEFNGSFYFLAGNKLVRQELSPKTSEVLADNVSSATISPSNTKVAFQSGDKTNSNRLTVIDLVNNKRTSYKNVINYAWHKNNVVMFSESGDETGYNLTDSSGKLIGENITVVGIYPTEKEILARTELDPNVSDVSSEDISINSILPASSSLTKLAGVRSSVVGCGNSLIYRSGDGRIKLGKSGEPVKVLDAPIDKTLVVCGEGSDFYVLNINTKNTQAEVISVDAGGNTQSSGFIKLSKSKFVLPEENTLDGKVVFSNGYFYIASDSGVVRYKL